jgi:hypothetical protein
LSIKLQRAVPETRRTPILQQCDLAGDLVTLSSEQRAQRRILNPLDLNVVKVAFDQVRIEVERPRLQGGDRFEPGAFEVCPRLAPFVGVTLSSRLSSRSSAVRRASTASASLSMPPEPREVMLWNTHATVN